MKSQPQNPEFRNNPKSFHPGMMAISEKIFLKKLHYLYVLTSCSYLSSTMAQMAHFSISVTIHNSEF